MSDPRIVFGARCTWWDSIAKVGHTAPGPSGHPLPACPHCGGVLFEMKDENAWWPQVERFELDGHPGYRKFVTWLRGRCFATLAEAVTAFRLTGGFVEL